MAVVSTGSLLEVCTTLNGMAAGGGTAARPSVCRAALVVTVGGKIATFSVSVRSCGCCKLTEACGTSGGGPPALPSSLPLARGEPELSESLLSLLSLLEQPRLGTELASCGGGTVATGAPPVAAAGAGTRAVVAGALWTGGGIVWLIVATGFPSSDDRS